MSLAERLAKTERPDRIAEVRGRVQKALIDGLGPKLYDPSLSERQLQDLVHRRIQELLEDEQAGLSSQEKAQVIQQIGDSVLGLGPLETYIRDRDVTGLVEGTTTAGEREAQRDGHSHRQAA